MKKILSIFNKESKLNIFGILLISILPAVLLSRSAVLNILILIINFFFLFIIFREKKLDFFNNKYFYALLIFWISLLINSIFSIDILNSLRFMSGLTFTTSLGIKKNAKQNNIICFGIINESALTQGVRDSVIKTAPKTIKFISAFFTEVFLF